MATFVHFSCRLTHSKYSDSNILRTRYALTEKNKPKNTNIHERKYKNVDSISSINFSSYHASAFKVEISPI
jgi:hypothetical protein